MQHIMHVVFWVFVLLNSTLEWHDEQPLIAGADSEEKENGVVKGFLIVRSCFAAINENTFYKFILTIVYVYRKLRKSVSIDYFVINTV